MVWADISFRTISHIAMNDPASGLRNTLVAEQIINGYVANQVLAIRRLLDGRKDVISLRRLLIDMRSNFHLFTRENCVCYNGLPYDYEAIREKDYVSRPVEPGRPQVFWVSTTGPDGWGGSQAAHHHFDKMANILPQNRKRSDRLPSSLLDAVESWLEHTDANELADWSHAYLAHAGNPANRERIKDAQVTNAKITEAIKCISRATEALSSDILYHAGRMNALMPTPQFDQFDGLNQPLMKAEAEEEARELWKSLTQERDASLGEVTSDLIAYRDRKENGPSV